MASCNGPTFACSAACWMAAQSQGFARGQKNGSIAGQR
jgi:hypothetical protein